MFVLNCLYRMVCNRFSRCSCVSVCSLTAVLSQTVCNPCSLVAVIILVNGRVCFRAYCHYLPRFQRIYCIRELVHAGLVRSTGTSSKKHVALHGAWLYRLTMLPGSHFTRTKIQGTVNQKLNIVLVYTSQVGQKDSSRINYSKGTIVRN